MAWTPRKGSTVDGRGNDHRDPDGRVEEVYERTRRRVGRCYTPATLPPAPAGRKSPKTPREIPRYTPAALPPAPTSGTRHNLAPSVPAARRRASIRGRP